VLVVGTSSIEYCASFLAVVPGEPLSTAVDVPATLAGPVGVERTGRTQAVAGNGIVTVAALTVHAVKLGVGGTIYRLPNGEA
jgi:hypothetical protein